MPPGGLIPLRTRRSVTLWTVTTCTVAALALSGCAGSVTADEQTLLAGAAAIAATPDPVATTAEPAPSTSATVPPEDALVTSTPDARVLVDSLAPGFPSDLLPMPDDAVLLVTSAVSIGDAGVKEVSLNLRTTWSTARILDLYRTQLTEVGFSEVPTVDTALTAETTFTRSDGDELVSIGVLDDDGVRTVTVGGRVRAGG